MTLAVREETILRRGRIIFFDAVNKCGRVRDKEKEKSYFFWADNFKSPPRSHAKPVKGDDVVYLLGKDKRNHWMAKRVAVEKDYVDGVVNFDDYIAQFT